jgi:hypothetical protein
MANGVPFLATIIKALAPINRGLINGGFLVAKDLLVRFDEITGNSILRDLQSICGLYLLAKKVQGLQGLKGF